MADVRPYPCLMCGIGGAAALRGRIESPKAVTAVISETSCAHRGPDGEGTGPRRAGTSASRTAGSTIIDLDDRRPADARRRRQLDHLQRRDLQLPRAAPRARRGRLPHDVRHRGRPARLPRAGAPALRRAAARHVRVRDLGRGARTALLRARPLRHQAALLRGASTASSTSPPRRRRCCRSCRRSRPTSRRSRTTSPSSSASPARRCSRACRSCCPGTR